MSNLSEKLSRQYPYLSILRYGNKTEYIGIIQHADTSIITFYDFGALKDSEERKLYLELAEKWWHETNRSLPINIYHRHKWNSLAHTIKSLVTRETLIIFGPSTSLNSLAVKKRRKIVPLNPEIAL